MPGSTLRKKKIRLYDHLIQAMENPKEHPMLRQTLLANSTGKKCQSPIKIPEEMHQIRERLEMLEWEVNQQRLKFEANDWVSQKRIAMLEIKIEVICAVIAKLINKLG